MPSTRGLALPALALSLLAACQPDQTARHISAAHVVDAIKSDEVHWNTQWKYKNPDDLMGHYAPDAVLMVDNAAPASGAPAIRALIQGALEDPAFAYSFSSERIVVAKSFDLAVARGAYTETGTDPATKQPRTVQGAYVMTYAPGPDGGWRVTWQIDTPGPAAKTTAPAPGA
ncbi:MAG TPA: nuclear transport factor 2 family protein [Caulobacteraceae bacterium]|nr:nuclear transport factor 2 family protein [Caulobacteraceae bacterium]